MFVPQFQLVLMRYHSTSFIAIHVNVKFVSIVHYIVTQDITLLIKELIKLDNVDVAHQLQELLAKDLIAHQFALKHSRKCVLVCH